MKKTIFQTAFLFVLAVCLAGSLSAQERLKRVLERCEASPNTRTFNKTVDLLTPSGVPGGKQITKVITIDNDQALIDQVIAAFDADKKNAWRVSENSGNGRLTSFECALKIDGRMSLYRFNRSGHTNGNATLTFTQSPEGFEGGTFVEGNQIRLNEGYRITTGQISRQADSLRFYYSESFNSEQMDSMKGELARTIQEYQKQLQQMMQRLQQDLQREQRND